MYATNMDDMLNAMFGGNGFEGMSGGGMRGGGGFQRRGHRTRRGRDAEHTLPVTLEDLYNGKSVQLDRRRTVICPDCKGSGSRRKNVPRGAKICPLCRGSGCRVTVRQMGMMVQQLQSVCEECQGSGERVDPQDRCRRCSGSKTTEVDAPLTVVIEKGMSHREELLFRRMADEDPDMETPGDLLVSLQQVKHDTFTRQDANLHMQCSITLAEALCGFQHKFKHLDGRELVIRRVRGEVTRPGDVKLVVGEGMPMRSRGERYGDLIIEFEICYPERIDKEQMDLLRTALPPPRNVDMQSSVDDDPNSVCYVTRERMEVLEQAIKRDEAEEEEEGGGQPSVNCAAQ